MGQHKNPRKCGDCKNYAPGKGVDAAIKAEWKCSAPNSGWLCCGCIEIRECKRMIRIANTPRRVYSPKNADAICDAYEEILAMVICLMGPWIMRASRYRRLR